MFKIECIFLSHWMRNMKPEHYDRVTSQVFAATECTDVSSVISGVSMELVAETACTSIIRYWCWVSRLPVVLKTALVGSVLPMPDTWKLSPFAALFCASYLWFRCKPEPPILQSASAVCFHRSHSDLRLDSLLCGMGKQLRSREGR
jgi:hypothetical protein